MTHLQMIFPWKPPFIVDFPASYVSHNQIVPYELSHVTWLFIPIFRLAPRLPSGPCEADDAHVVLTGIYCLFGATRHSMIRRVGGYTDVYHTKWTIYIYDIHVIQVLYMIYIYTYRYELYIYICMIYIYIYIHMYIYRWYNEVHILR